MDKILPQNDKQISAVSRTFSILEALSKGELIGVTELASQVDLSKATVYRFLQTMLSLGYIAQEGDSDKYRLTIKMFELGAGALANVDLIRLADAEMRKLSNTTRETIHLGVLDQDSFVYVHKIDSLYTLRMHSRIGSRNALHSTAIGKVLLAGMTEAQREEVMSLILFTQATPTSIMSVEALRARVKQVMLLGYGEDNEEQEIGVRCFAVPIYDRFNAVCAALSISFPVMRQDAEIQEQFVLQLKAVGEQISKGLRA